ncbi:MAG: hypothetical protein WBZ48_10245 [Bacteroidota bacterium]
MRIPVIAYIAAVSYSIPTIAGSFRFKHLSNAMKALLLFCFFSCVEVGVEYVLGRKHINNSFLSNYSNLIEPSLISAVYFLSVKNKMTKDVILLLAFLFLSVLVIDKIFYDVPNQLNETMSIISGIFIIIISVLTLYTIVSTMNNPLVNEPIFWVSSGTLIYSAGVLFVFSFSNELLKMGYSYFEAAWHVNWSLVIVANAMYTKGFFTGTN